jgi:nitroreductase
MRPQREVFALDYIERTLDCFVCMLNKGSRNCPVTDPTLNWAADVLNKYFECTTDNAIVIRARKKYELAIKSFRWTVGGLVPFKRDLYHLPISYGDLMSLAKRRRSVRWYLQKTVPREIIDKAILVALQAPSACNRQPFEFRIFDDRDLIKKIARIPMGARGFYGNIPCLIIVIGKQRYFFDERDRHIIYIDAGLAVMALKFALEVQGISSCCINWPDIPDNNKTIRGLLNIEIDDQPIMLISLGYPDPDGLVTYSQKKTLEETRSYNQL